MNTAIKTGLVLFAALAAVCFLPIFSSSAGSPSKATAHYKVSSRGFSIGDVTTSQHMAEENGNSTLHFETRTSVKASFLWMGYQLHSNEKGILRNGALVGYSHKGEENGTPIDVEGRLENGAFVFDVREQGGTRSLVISRSSYDYTTMECPEARLDFSDRKEITLRVLDVEKMAVVKRTYTLVRNTHYSIAGKELPCRIVDFSDHNKKARRWIAWDGTAVILYRQDSRGEKSVYSVQATSVVRER